MLLHCFADEQSPLVDLARRWVEAGWAFRTFGMSCRTLRHYPAARPGRFGRQKFITRARPTPALARLLAGCAADGHVSRSRFRVASHRRPSPRATEVHLARHPAPVLAAHCRGAGTSSFPGRCGLPLNCPELAAVRHPSGIRPLGVIDNGDVPISTYRAKPEESKRLFRRAFPGALRITGVLASGGAPGKQSSFC